MPLKGYIPYVARVQKAPTAPPVAYHAGRAIAKTVISENQFCKSKNRKLLKVAGSGYLDEIGRYPILRDALERAGYLPPPEGL